MSYGRGGTLASGGTAALAYTGFNLYWVIVFALTMIAVGLALGSMIPRRER